MTWIIPSITTFIIVVICFIFLRSKPAEESPEEVLPFYANFFFTRLKWLFDSLAVPLKELPGFGRGGSVTIYMRQLLDKAGLYEFDEEAVMASQFVTGAALYLIFLSFLAQLSLRAAIFTCLPMIVVGWGIPIYVLQRTALERRQRIYADLPYVLDLLSLGIEAGLDFKVSVERLVNFSEPSPLLRELRGLLNDLNFGTPMEEALLRLRRRIDILAFFTFVEALIQATQMGIDVSSTLRAQAEQMRVSYFQNVEKEANGLPIMVLFPTALLIFPTILMLTLGPVILDVLQKMDDIQRRDKKPAVSGSVKSNPQIRGPTTMRVNEVSQRVADRG